MNKKIIAVFCAVIMIAAVFTACGKKPEKINVGSESNKIPAVTNKDGEVVTNAQGEIAVYITDEKGNYEKDENGEPMTQYQQKTAAVILNPNNTVTKEIFTVPVIDGWMVVDGETMGRIYKKDTDMKCYINFSYAAKETEDQTFDTIIGATSEQNRKIVDGINSGAVADKGFAKAEMKEEETTFAGYKAYRAVYIAYDANGKVVHYADTVYFLYSEGEIYSASYVCEDGVGYDADFDFYGWANSNMKIKEPARKTVS